MKKSLFIRQTIFNNVFTKKKPKYLNYNFDDQ